MSEETNDKSIFSMEATVSQTASGIMRILVLMRMDEMLRDHQAYNNATQGSGEEARLLRKSINSILGLLRLLRPRMKERGKYDDIELLARNNPGEAINGIMEYLENDLKLTKIDTKQEYNRKRWGEAIKARS